MPHKTNHRMGWRPDRPDQRDYEYVAPIDVLKALPTSVDLRPQCPPVYDQGQLGSCTANAIAGAIEFDQMKQKETAFTPSRLYIYYNERAMEGTIASDAGAALRDGIQSVNSQGVCNETEWVYDITKFTAKPPQQCYTDAQLTKALTYQRLTNTNINQLKGCLAAGSPFVFGFTVYQSFETQQVASTGVVPMPRWGEQVLGGHAVMCVGFSDIDHTFLIKNSWGTSWGMQGFCTMPQMYITSSRLASDFWTISTIS